jgi:hypothetical protein
VTEPLAVIVVSSPGLTWVAEGPIPLDQAVARARSHWTVRSLWVRSVRRSSSATVAVHLLGPRVDHD